MRGQRQRGDSRCVRWGGWGEGVWEHRAGACYECVSARKERTTGSYRERTEQLGFTPALDFRPRPLDPAGRRIRVPQGAITGPGALQLPITSDKPTNCRVMRIPFIQDVFLPFRNTVNTVVSGTQHRL